MADKDYVLGTHDEEIERLALQHQVWRPRMLDAWKRAGFTIDQTLMDVGCGPGNATIDLAEIVGSSGKVIALDRSKRFLDALSQTQKQHELTNIEAIEHDFNDDSFPSFNVDGVWCRWVFAFVKNPKTLLSQITNTLKPGGVMVIHEYVDYSNWRMLPRLPELEDFVREVMASWRADGGEPDIGAELPTWLANLGFELKELKPIMDIIPASNFVWQWPKAFVDVNLRRLQQIGRITKDRASNISRAISAAEAAPHTLMVTPAVIEIIAIKK
ncbi:MAG: class I SAM-dependent methyltransferase [Bacteroidota bacterium]